MLKHLRFIVPLFFIYFVISCARGSFDVNNIVAVPFEENGTAGLCVWASLDLDKTEGLKMQVHSPDGNLTWSVPVNTTEYAGEKWYGNSDIFMPDTSKIPDGMWTVDFLSKDGRTRSASFDVKL